MRTDELDYDFDASLVATEPAQPRDAARLMVIDRAKGSISHATVRDLPRFLGAGDALVVNRTSVLRARVLLRELSDDGATGRATEGLLLEPCAQPGHWRVLLRQAKRFAGGARLALVDHRGAATEDSLELVARDAEAWIARLVPGALGGDVAEILERSGHTPLPPYILKARRDAGLLIDDDEDRAEYETVYADRAMRGSVAAPTAGLHFTRELLDEIAAKGVATRELVLHVGAGTFKPIEVDDLRDHPMHTESLRVPATTLRALHEAHEARRAGRARLVAVGTTTVRALESLPDPLPGADRGDHGALTNILISPGHRFRFVDALLTNFHLPRSTLLALVGAFTGMELMREAYATAVRERYRFYSYGDAMLIV